MSSGVRVQIGDLLQSSTTCYEVINFTGEGVFGKVAKCRDLMTKESVAVKIHKQSTTDDTVEWEVDMLKKVRALDPEKTNIVRFIDHFISEDYSCIAFEMLEMSLWDLVRRRQQPLSLHEIRPVTHQLLGAFEALKKIGIIHADLKPDNVMLVSLRHQPYKIKLIDFGLAVPSNKVRVGATMQAESYRAPEVTLGLPLSEAVDMWGVGCVMAFLYFGTNLFPNGCPYHRIKTMVQLVGLPAKHHMLYGVSTTVYFSWGSQVGWRLRTPAEYEAVTGEKPEVRERFFDSFKNLMDAVKRCPPKTDAVEYKDRREFFYLLKSCLNPNPELRITPREALSHNFVTMAHLRDDLAANSYAEAALQLMSVCPPVKSEEPEDDEDHEDSSNPAVVPDVDNNPSCHSGHDSLSLSGYDADKEDASIDTEGDSNTISIRNCCSCSYGSSISSQCHSSGNYADIESISSKPVKKQLLQYFHPLRHHCPHKSNKTFEQPAPSCPLKEHQSPSSPSGDLLNNKPPGSSSATNSPPKEEPSSAAHPKHPICTSSNSLPAASDNNSSPAEAEPADGTAASGPSNKAPRQRNVFQRLNKLFGRARRRVISLFALGRK